MKCRLIMKYPEQDNQQNFMGTFYYSTIVVEIDDSEFTMCGPGDIVGGEWIRD